MSKVSVIVPIYNSESYLDECIVSILNQTYTDLEVILINDGSTDSSLDICKYYKSNDSRIVIIDKKNEGVASARNAGLNLATGKYVAFVDSDDVILNNLYEKLVGMLNDSTSDCAVLSKYIVNKKNEVILNNGQIIDSDHALEMLLFLKFPTSLWAYLYKKDLLLDIRLNENIHFFEDLDFNFRAIFKSKLISICTEDLYLYRQHSASINHQGVNAKRLTCLDIPNAISEYLYKFNEFSLMKKVRYLDAYFILTSLLPLTFPLSKEEGQYAKFVVVHARNTLPSLIFSKSVPIKFKVFVALVSLNVNLALRIRDSI